MALATAQIEVELREISLKNRPQELYNISSKATVPVLQLSDSTVIDESLDIMYWALEKPSSDWLNYEFKKQNKMISFNDFKFKPWLDKYKYSIRFPEASIQSYQKQCEKMLLPYENDLSRTKYLIDNKIQLVDMAIFPFIRQFANVDRIWFESRFPNIERWLEEFIQSKLFKRVMIKYKPWCQGDNPKYVVF